VVDARACTRELGRWLPVEPDGRAIIDTYTSFCVGDSGLTLHCTNDDVRVVAEEFWNDPANCLGDQDIMLRSHLLNGESAYEMMTGEFSGVVRRSVIDPLVITGVTLRPRQPALAGAAHHRNGGADTRELDVIQVDDLTGLRTARCCSGGRSVRSRPTGAATRSSPRCSTGSTTTTR
jgi:hypothetical protein